MQKGWLSYTLFYVFQPLTQICTFKLLIPCRSISGEFDLTKILMISSFSMTTYNHTHKFGNTGSNHKSWTVLPYPPISPDLASWELCLIGTLTRCHPWEKFWEWWYVLEEVATNAEFRWVQEEDRCTCFLLVQGCWSWWRLCRKISCELHTSSYCMSMLKDICNKLVISKKKLCCNTFSTAFVFTSLHVITSQETWILVTQL